MFTAERYRAKAAETAEQYRAKAAEYAARLEQTVVASEIREFRDLERSFSVLADNEEWLAANYEKTIHSPRQRDDSALREEDEHLRPGGNALAKDEEHILRCLGASVLMLWNVIPTKLQRELFDKAGSIGGVLDDTLALRGQIARFLHNHKDDQEASR
jgi:hypothetical protein